VIRVLIVSENVSLRMGGEASLPYYYAKLLAKRGAEVSLACHERVRNELLEAFAELGLRIHFVRDTPMQKLAHRWGSALPPRIRDLVIDQAIHFGTQARIRRVALGLACAGSIDVVFEPAPITPKGLSFMYGLGVPVVIGPLCGGMDFPPAFRDLDSVGTRQFISLAKSAANIANYVVPGKIRAEVLLVANQSTAQALPRGHRGEVVRLFESGVDLGLWDAEAGGAGEEPREPGSVRFVFSGRFVDWKGIQYLVPAFAKAAAQARGCTLDLIGGGELEGLIRGMVEQLGLNDTVRIHGWLPRPDAVAILRRADVFVMPSLRECGGTAILEAMALGKPVITTNWGGPADYVKPSCGILVDPSSKESFIAGLAEAMLRLARSPEMRNALGAGGKSRVREDGLDWDSKADRVLSILASAAGRASASATPGFAR